MDELLVFRGDRLVRRVPLGKGPVLIGRGAAADLVLEGSGISRAHARLEPDGPGWRVEDAGSTHGLRVDGTAKPSGRLLPGGCLEIGEYRLYLLPPAEDGEQERESESEGGALEDLFLATARVDAGGDPAALLAEMLDAAMEVFDAERGLVLVADTTGRFEPALARGMNEDEAASQTVAREVATRGSPVLLADTGEGEAFAGAPSLEASGARSVLCAPLDRGGARLGVVYLDGPALARLYTDRDLRLLGTFAQHVAAAYEALREARRSEERARAARRLQRDADREAGRDPAGLVAASPVTRRLLDQVDAVAARDTTALLLGESGTGKELLARAIHDRSPRKDAPFVAVNCMALVSDLAASELFGHERGAFTGAAEARPGRFELADGGTLFLDEVGELSPEMQVRLLRVLQERTFERVGGREPRRVDVRVVAATNRDMKAAVGEGAFREDLWYRLNVFPLEVPPLRARPEDVPALVEHFVDHFRASFGKPLGPPDGPVMALLQAYPWPGNVRELRNIVERAFVLETGDRIGPGSLPAEILEAGSGPTGGAGIGSGGPAGFPFPRDFHQARERFERQFLRRALVDHQGNMTAAAEEAGVPRKTIYRKLKSLGTSVEELLDEAPES